MYHHIVKLDDQNHRSVKFLKWEIKIMQLRIWGPKLRFYQN